VSVVIKSVAVTDKGADVSDHLDAGYGLEELLDWPSRAHGPVIEDTAINWGDVRGLLSGELPEPPKPEALFRSDGHAVLYSGQVNMFYGEPESGKTWVALAAIAETILNGGKAVFIDLDHNGLLAIVTRLIFLGVTQNLLMNPDRFRSIEPEDADELKRVIKFLKLWKPDVAVVDSVGELLPALNLNSSNPDDFTKAHTSVLKPLAMVGSCVIVIDHVPKNVENKVHGPTGTAAKKRAIGGAMIRVVVKSGFAPGQGGSCFLAITKDRHGGLKAISKPDKPEFIAGTFKLRPEGGWSVFAPATDDHVGASAPAEDLDALEQLSPPPATVAEARKRLGWAQSRTMHAMKAWREQQARES
jgi:hypothetical protein